MIDGIRRLLHHHLERVMGIEPTPVAWEATTLPLSYTRIDRCNKNSIRESDQGSRLAKPAQPGR